MSAMNSEELARDFIRAAEAYQALNRMVWARHLRVRAARRAAGCRTPPQPIKKREPGAPLRPRRSKRELVLDENGDYKYVEVDFEADDQTEVDE